MNKHLMKIKKKIESLIHLPSIQAAIFEMALQIRSTILESQIAQMIYHPPIFSPFRSPCCVKTDRNEAAGLYFIFFF